MVAETPRSPVAASLVDCSPNNPNHPLTKDETVAGGKSSQDWPIFA